MSDSTAHISVTRWAHGGSSAVLVSMSLTDRECRMPGGMRWKQETSAALLVRAVDQVLNLYVVYRIAC